MTHLSLFTGIGGLLASGANKYGDVWEIQQERNNPHPAPFPVELAERMIASTDAKVILDPFVGSGTTPVAAIKLGREYIGIDHSEEYCRMARERIRMVTNGRDDDNGTALQNR